MKRNLIFGAAALLGLLSLSPAAVYTVTNTNDTGAGSLRQAVDDANGNAGSDTVDFSLGIGSHTITLTSGEIEITEALTIQKPFAGLSTVAVSGNGASRVFLITSSGSGTITLRRFTVRDGLADPHAFGGGLHIHQSNTPVILENMTFTDNEAPASGGGLSIYGGSGSVVLDHCKIVNNVCGVSGGALLISGSESVVRIEKSEIVGNSAYNGGGVSISTFEGSLEIDASTISGNAAIGTGGAVSLLGVGVGPTLTFTNTTISGNSTDSIGGGLYITSGTGTLTNCTITNNTADADNDGIGSVGGLWHSGDETITLTNCLVAGNFGPAATDGDVDGDELASGGHNLIGIGSRLDGFTDGSDGDQIGSSSTPIDPMLGPLGDHGGPTETHVLLTGSPAIDVGDSAAITDPPFEGPTFEDQIGNDRIVGNAVDIGATEFQDILVVTSTADSGNGSLREAVADANATGGKTILFDESVFGSLQTIALTSGEIVISNSVVVSGPVPGVIISAGNTSRVFRVTASGTGAVEFKNLRLVDGFTTAHGGAVRIGGVGTEVVLRQCGVSNSHANGQGGGLFVNQATATLFGCTVSGNDADDSGGGLECSGNGTLNVLQSTVSGNSTLQRGGGLFAISCTAVVLNSTITNNTADAGAANLSNGGGIRRGADAMVSVGNSIIAGNVDASSAGSVHPDVSGEIVSLGHNLIGIDDGLEAGGTPFTNGVNGDQVGSSGSPINPGLSALSLPSGAITRVHLLQSGSPARDGGDDALLEDTVWPSSPRRDQRGQFRVVNGSVDIGAIEYPNGVLVSLLAIDDALNEYTEGSGKIRVSRSFDVGDLDVTLEIPAGSGAQASDVVDGMSTFVVTIPDGKPFTTVSFAPVKDGMVEGNETLTIKLVNAAGYSVDPTLGDQTDLTIWDGDFLVSNGNDAGSGSLRSAVEGANAAEGGLIVIPQGTGPVELLTGQLVINAEMTIEGNGASIDAGGNSRLFRIDTGGVGCVRLKDLILTGGASDFEGGAVKVWPTSCLVITRCALTGNTAQKTGGGLYFEDADVTIRNSSIDSNTVTDSEGGGIHGVNGSLEMVSSTVAKNSAPFHGGGVALEGTVASLTNVTITANTCDSNDDGVGNGGGLWSQSPGSQAEIVNTLIAGNFDTPGNAGSGDIRSDVAGKVHTLGHNLIGDNTGEETDFPFGVPNANDDYAGSFTNQVNPQLTEINAAPLYYLPSLGSLAVDNGDTLAVSSPPFDTPPTDQRGRSRAIDGAVDIGAIEMDYLPVLNTNDSGFGSLRGRIGEANALGHGTIIFTNAGPVTIPLTSGQLQLTTPTVSICAPSATNRVTIDAGNNSRVLQILPTTSGEGIHLKNLILTGGLANGVVPSGGGIHVDGGPNLLIESCAIRGNTADGSGGGISNGGQALGGSALTLIDSEISGNTALNGGGLFQFEGAADVQRCTFNDNQALDGALPVDGRGGGIYADFNLSLTSCTVSGNVAEDMGGGIFAANGTTLDLLFATIVENECQGGGGGVLAESGSTVNVWNTIIASNEDSIVTFDDVRGSFTSQGSNFIGNGKGTVSFGFTGENDQVGTTAAPLDPLLDPLADNGGLTQTHFPKIYSPVVEAGQNTGVMSVDQRGLPRISPIDGNPDIGAVEQTLLDYSTWAATAFPPGEYLDSRAPEDDPDGDGIPNGMEFVTGLAPGAHDEDPYKGRIEDGKLVLRYPVGVDVSPFATAVVEGSNNMTEWSESGVELRVFEDLGAGGLVMEARLPINNGTLGRRFLRVRFPVEMSDEM